MPILIKNDRDLTAVTTEMNVFLCVALYELVAIYKVSDKACNLKIEATSSGETLKSNDPITCHHIPADRISLHQEWIYRILLFDNLPTISPKSENSMKMIVKNAILLNDSSGELFRNRNQTAPWYFRNWNQKITEAKPWRRRCIPGQRMASNDCSKLVTLQERPLITFLTARSASQPGNIAKLYVRFRFI